MHRVVRVATGVLFAVLPIVATTTSCTQAVSGTPLAVSAATASPPPANETSTPPSSTSAVGLAVDLASLEGTWEGGYTCGQGRTGVRLVIGTVAGEALPTIFKFFPLPENPGAATGSYSMIGKNDGGRLVFRQDKWISRPDGYSMVDLEVSEPPSGDTLSGKVIGASCAAFSVHRQR